MQSDNPIEQPAFTRFELSELLFKAIADLGFIEPTPVQQQAIPVILQKHDVLVSAETGSGKTVAFLLPILQRLLDQPSFKTATRVLILTPTRELARQIQDNCKQLAQYTEITCGLITGGDDFKRQQHLFTKGTDIVIATPGRLQELLVSTPAPDLATVDVLILDEADRMLDMGFRDDVLNISDYCNPDRQTLLFSATLTHPGIVKIAKQILNNPHTIALNSLQESHRNINQQMILSDSTENKQQQLLWLLQHEDYDKALVFVNSRLQAVAVQNFLMGQGVRVGALHGDLDQKDRNRIMQLYRNDVINTLVATDLAARGLDVAGINLVMNFEVPRNGITYIHRIGRSGRANEQGVAITLVMHTEWNLMASIERYLKQHCQRRELPEFKARYRGPKKVKASGKAASHKSKSETKKPESKKIKIRDRDKKNIGKRRKPTVLRSE